MTIAAGFKFHNGLILAADTQHTYSKMLKLSRPKIVRLDFPDHKARIGIAIAGFVDFAIMASEKIKREISGTGFSLREIKDCIEEVVLDVHRKHVYPSGAPNELGFDLLVGAWTEEEGINLLQTSLTGVTELENFGIIGIGLYLAQYLSDSYHPRQKTSDDALTFVVDVFRKVKANVDGCGGDTTILIMEADGAWRQIPNYYVTRTENFTKTFDELTQELIRVSSDLALEEHEIDEFLDLVKDEIHNARVEQRAKKDRLDSFLLKTKKQSES